MATTPNTAKVPVASSHRSNFPMNGEHLTTTNFMDFNISKKMGLVPGQSVNIKHQLFTRLEPMTVPTFGDAVIHNRAFFVPYRVVFPAWNDFITDVAHVYPNGSVAHVSNVPAFANKQLMYLFTLAPDLGTRRYATAEQVDGDPEYFGDSADLIFKDFQGNYSAVTLNYKGRRFLRILQQLGYGIETNENVADYYVSALPLFCSGKLYIDWYYPQAYVQDERAQVVASYFNRDSANFEITYNEIYNILSVIDVVNYDNDYFTGAWDNPTAPTDGSFSPVSITDYTMESNATTVSTAENGTPEAKWSFNLTQFTDDALHAMTDYMKRHQIAGARALDRYMARFGIKLSSDKILYSQFLHEYNDYIQFGDVTSMAASEGVPLGDFAGKGIGLMNGKFEYTADEYGMLFIITTIVPRIGYYQGMHRENMHLSKLDFFTPEYDCLGVQAVTRSELFMPLSVFDKGDENAEANENVFGFVPRYGELKIGYDQITGDYRVKHLNTGKDAWTLFRDVSSFFNTDGATGVHDINFVRGTDNAQYDRIFTYTGRDADHFNVHHQFKIQCSFPAKSLYDNYEFENEDDSKKVTMNVNGVKAN